MAISAEKPDIRYLAAFKFLSNLPIHLLVLKCSYTLTKHVLKPSKDGLFLPQSPGHCYIYIKILTSEEKYYGGDAVHHSMKP